MFRTWRPGSIAGGRLLSSLSLGSLEGFLLKDNNNNPHSVTDGGNLPSPPPRTHRRGVNGHHRFYDDPTREIWLVSESSLLEYGVPGQVKQIPKI